MKFNFLLCIVSLVMALQGCQDEDNIENIETGGYPINFDKSTVHINSLSDSVSVKATPQGPFDSYEGWGIERVLISENNETKEFVNSFDSIIVNEHENYQVFKTEVVGKWYLIQKRQDCVFVKLQENSGDERSLKIDILGYGGIGSFTVIQQGKGE